MDVKQQIQAILTKKMDRQDFMKHVAIGVVAMSGASNALRLLGASKQVSDAESSEGYGSAGYGGDDEPIHQPHAKKIS